MPEGRGVLGRRKVLVPTGGPAVLPRPDLEERLDEARRRRLTVVTAAPGLGKTTLLAGWAKRRRSAWYTVTDEDRDPAVFARGLLEAARMRVPALDPTAVAPSATGEGWAIPSGGQGSLAADQVVGMLTERLEDDLTMVLDDVHELGGSESSTQLLGDLVRESPPGLHLVLSSRADPPFPVARLRAQGLAIDLPGSALRFSEAETAAVATTLLGPAGEEVAALLCEQTAGWPAAVRVIAEWLRRAPVEQWPSMVLQAADPGGPLEAFLVEEVLPATPDGALELLPAVVSLVRFNTALAAEVVGAGAEDLVALLARDGLWVVPDGRGRGWFVVPPVLCRVIRSRLAVRSDDSAVLIRRAAAWMEGRGETGPALTGLLADRGRALPHLPPESSGETDGTAVSVTAAARLIQGDYDEAMAIVRPALGGDGPVPMSAGLVAALVYHFRGELDEAIAMYERALAGPGTDALRGMVLGWAAAASWLRGDVEQCRRRTEEAEAAARASGDDRAWAMVHTSLGMLAALDGDRQAMRHYDRALAHAEAAHDHLQIVRLRTNRGSRLLAEGYCREALVELDEAVRLAELAGIGMIGATALTNRGETLMALGRLDEAARELEAAKARYERLGSRMAGYALAHLGSVHRLQGHLTLARAYYEEAIAIGEASGDHQGLVPALAGLALVLADTDAEEAIRLAGRAASLASIARPKALIAAAEAAMRTGDLAAAASGADEASRAARARRDRPALADALELQARVCGDPETAARLLEEAATIWVAIGNPLGEARVLLAQARLGGPHAQTAAAEAERALRRLGARTLASEAAALQRDLANADRPAVAIRVLGGFAIERDGTAIATTEWQSRKARDLLKVLIARRGRRVAREVLLDLLWPEEGAGRASSRLSVTLSTLRSVLDPGKRFDAEHFIANDRTSVWLQLEHVTIDIEAFLTAAQAGLRAFAAGDTANARRLLAAAETGYAGDFLEEDLYEDWSLVLREEARATYVSVAMALADLALAAGDHDGAARYLLRVLARDPYDERAHLKLVTALAVAGRHGEARRMYRAYCSRMADLDVEPAAFPDARARLAGASHA